jgi:hypothetical protein
MRPPLSEYASGGENVPQAALLSSNGNRMLVITYIVVVEELTHVDQDPSRLGNSRA